METWAVGDLVRPARGRTRVREEVVYADGEMVVTRWKTMAGGWHVMYRTPREMERYMERVG